MPANERRGYWSATPILPEPFKDKFMQAALREFMNDTADDIEKDIRRPIAKWKHTVKIDKFITAFYFPLRMQLEVTVDDDPYTYMDRGTKAHMVRPKRKQALHWGEGQGPGGKGFFSKGHMVKGIHARNWMVFVKRRWDKKLAVDFDKLMQFYAQKSGHAVR